MPKTKAKQEWLVMGPEPHLGSCLRCGTTIPKPPFPLEIDIFLGYLAGARTAHADCQEAGDGEDEAALRRAQPQASEDADEEAVGAPPAPADGAPAAPGSVICICTDADDPNDHRKDCPYWWGLPA